MKNIRSLPLSLRPREKLLKFGPAALTLEELISVILVTGNRTASVSQIATKIAKLAKKSSTLDVSQLHTIAVGSSKSAQILAAIELGKRLSTAETVSFTSAESVFAYSYEIAQQEKESLLCFYINARNEMIKKEILAVGSLNRVNLLPREIFSVIKDLPVAGIILVHNHPSGNLDASDDDILFTKRVKAAGDILGIKLLDHLIISQKGWKKIKL